mmetsp:Transcript_129000/g.412424  ORF Transcript_129000/g.412424 Transcript_129000/m.412424 type:complete len:201 (+) Transcript_129000:2846-3448(+)
MLSVNALVFTVSGVTAAQSLLSLPTCASAASRTPNEAPASSRRCPSRSVGMTNMRTFGMGSFNEAPFSGQSAKKVRLTSGMPSTMPPRQCSLSLRRSPNLIRKGLLAWFFGKSGITTNTCGHFAKDSDCLHQCCTLRKLGRGMPSSMTIAMPMPSSRTSCGTMNAMQALTLGCDWTASSTSKGEIISPPRLMTSLERPVM